MNLMNLNIPYQTTHQSAITVSLKRKETNLPIGRKKNTIRFRHPSLATE